MTETASPPIDVKTEIRWIFDTIKSLVEAKPSFETVESMMNLIARQERLLGGIVSGQTPFTSEDLIVLTDDEAIMAIAGVGQHLCDMVSKTIQSR